MKPKFSGISGVALARGCVKFLWQLMLSSGVGFMVTAQAWAETRQTYQSECGQLSFADFPADQDKAIQTKAPLVLKRGMPAWLYRSVIRSGYESLPINFNGKYVAFEVGCGASCQFWVFVDATTGQIILPEKMSSLGAKFRLDSRLFVINPPDTDLEASTMGPEIEDKPTQFAVWKENDLQDVCEPASERVSPASSRGD